MTDRRLDRNWNEPIRYPDPAVEVLDARFRPYVLGSAAVERLWTGARWTEGPAWFGDGRYLVFSDIPNDRMLRWTEETNAVTVYRAPSHNANGNTRDRQGRLVTCEHGTRRVTRTEHDGTVTVLLDRFEGRRLNAPNDVVVHPTAASGSRTRATGSSGTTKATRPRSSCRPGSTGSTRRRVTPTW